MQERRRTAVEARGAGLGEELPPLLVGGRRLGRELLLVVRHPERLGDGVGGGCAVCLGYVRGRKEEEEEEGVVSTYMYVCTYAHTHT